MSVLIQSTWTENKCQLWLTFQDPSMEIDSMEKYTQYLPSFSLFQRGFFQVRPRECGLGVGLGAGVVYFFLLFGVSLRGAPLGGWP